MQHYLTFIDTCISVKVPITDSAYELLNHFYNDDIDEDGVPYSERDFDASIFAPTAIPAFLAGNELPYITIASPFNSDYSDWDLE